MYTIIQSKRNAIREKWCDIYSTLQRWMTWMRHLYCCSTDIGVNNPPILAASSPVLFKSQRPLVSMAVIPRQFTIKSLPFHSVLYVQYKSQPVVYSPRVCSLRLSGVSRSENPTRVGCKNINDKHEKTTQQPQTTVYAPIHIH